MKKIGQWRIKTLRCSSKNAYKTKGAAQFVASRRAKNTGENLNSYKCPMGSPKHWHIGHPPGSGRIYTINSLEKTDVVK